MSAANNAVVSIELQVKSISNSINFYTNVLNMKAEDSSSDQKCKMYVQSSKQEKDFPVVSLQASASKYQIGDAFQGIGIKSSNFATLFDKSSQYGGTVQTILGEYSFGASLQPDEDELAQFAVKYSRVKDPNGFEIELMDSDNIYPGMKLILNVLNLEESIDFYTKGLGMKLLRKRSNVNNRPRDASFSAYLGYGQEKDDFCIELVYKYATEKLDIGSVLEVGIGSSDIEALKTHMLSIHKDLQIVEDSRHCISFLDPNGYKIKVTPLRPGYII